MDEDLDYNEEEINELVTNFKSQADAGEVGYYDSDDLEVIAEELIYNCDLAYATEALELGIRLYPRTFAFRILKVKKLLMEFEIETAGKELDRIEMDFPPEAELYVEKAFFAKISGHDNDALPLLKKAYKLDPDHPEVNYMLGEEYLQRGEYQRAFDHICFALDEDETFEEQLGTLSFFFEEDKKYNDAILFFTWLTERYPLSKCAWFGLGLACCWAKEYESAIDAYQNVISLDEEASTAYFNIGNVYFEKKQYEEAIHYYEEAYRLDDHDFHAVSGIGDALLEMGRMDEALEKYHEALRIEPNTLDAIMGIITILKETGREEEAEHFIRKSFSLNPQSFELLFNLLPLYEGEDQIKKLKELFQYTLSQAQEKEEFLKFFTIYCTANRDLREMGIELMEDLLDNEEVAMTLPYFLAALHFLNGQFTEADQYFKTALIINYPGHEMFLGLSPALAEDPMFHNLIENYKPLQ